MRERRDDAVGGAGHPARVGGAPEDVVRVEVEGVLAGGVVGDTAWCTCTAPLGLPVVPVVKWINAMSSGGHGIANSSDALFIN